MDKELCALVGRCSTSPLSNAIRAGVYNGYKPAFFEGMEARWIKAMRVDRLERRDRVFAEQCRQSYDVADGLDNFGTLADEVGEVIAKMRDLGLIGNENEDIPVALVEKYSDYTIEPPNAWRVIGKMGGQFLIRVGKGISGPVVVLTDINSPQGLSLHSNTTIYAIDEIVKFSQEPITAVEG
ncbi:MAG TPA: hypothetical protein V6D27_00725 [Vampirovibrionales bacterium]